MLALTQTATGVFDLASDDGAADSAVATLVYTVLFTDAEAPAERAPDRFDRRGWWADPAAGTGLWHVRRQPLSAAARREALAQVRQALTAHGLTDVIVSDASTAGNVSSVFMAISGRHNGRTFAIRVPL